MTHSVVVSSPLGMLFIAISEGKTLREIELLPQERQGFRVGESDHDGTTYMLRCGGLAQDSSIVVDVVNQLSYYFKDPGWRFELPLAPSGTPFQQRVWEALRSIPSGKTVSYGELATRLGTGARAVGNACRKNPIPIVVPCHRVVGVRDFGGFMGARTGEPLAIKQWLLRHESSW